jgi:hypothetical protein
MQLKQPEPEHSQGGDHSRYSESMARPSDEGDDRSDDDDRSERARLHRTQKVAAKDVLDARRATAERARHACQRSKRTRQARVPREKREHRARHQHRDGGPTRIPQIDLQPLARPALRRHESLEEDLVAPGSDRPADLRAEPPG